MRKLILSIAFWSVSLGLFVRPAGALESIVIAYPTTSSQFAPLWFARDVGLYEKYGLDGQLVYIQGGSILLQAMLAGQAHAAQLGAYFLRLFLGALTNGVRLSLCFFPHLLSIDFRFPQNRA